MTGARAAAGLAALAVAAVVALVASGGPNDIELPVARVERRLPALRGLHFRRPPKVQIVSRDEGERLDTLASVLKTLPPADRARARRVQAQQRTSQAVAILLGLVPAHYSRKDLRGVVEYGGFYDQFSNRVYLVRDSIGRDAVQAESVLAHELTHALDEQNLGLDRYAVTPPLSDAGDAERALREGSATITQFRYDIRYLGDPGPVSRRLKFAAQLPARSKIARLAQIDLDFVYRFGARFVEALRRRGGTRLVDRALRNPPRTTAAILYPRRWPRDDRNRAPAALPAGALGPGFARSLQGDFGAVSIHELFAGTGPPAAVDRLARDWTGGRTELWRPAGARFDPNAPDRRSSAVVLAWRWRRPADTALARAAVTAYLLGTFRAAPSGRGTWRLRDGAAAYASAGRVSALVLAPTTGQALAAARAAVAPRRL